MHLLEWVQDFQHEVVSAHNESIQRYLMWRRRVRRTGSWNVFGRRCKSNPSLNTDWVCALSVNVFTSPQQWERQTYSSSRKELVLRNTIAQPRSVPTSNNLNGKLKVVSCLSGLHRVWFSQQTLYFSRTKPMAESDPVSCDKHVEKLPIIVATLNLSGRWSSLIGHTHHAMV